MSTLSFFVRPQLYCTSCGSAVMQRVSVSEPGSREVWCCHPPCPQFQRSVQLHDPTITLFERASDVVAEPAATQ